MADIGDGVASIGGAVDDDEISVRIFLANGPRALIFRAPVAGKGRRAVLELDHDVSFAGVAFHRFERPAAHDEACPKLLKRRACRRKIFGISPLVMDRNAPNPISL